jgi:hypothetical protein
MTGAPTSRKAAPNARRAPAASERPRDCWPPVRASDFGVVALRWSVVEVVVRVAVAVLVAVGVGVAVGVAVGVVAVAGLTTETTNVAMPVSLVAVST